MVTFLLSALPFLLRFVGENSIEKVLAHKRELLTSANEAEKNRLNADINFGAQLIEEKKIKRDLQLKEYEHPFLWWPKFLIMLGVDWYWFCVFMGVTLGISDFNIVIPELTEKQEAVSMLILCYQFLDGTAKRVQRAMGK